VPGLGASTDSNQTAGPTSETEQAPAKEIAKEGENKPRSLAPSADATEPRAVAKGSLEPKEITTTANAAQEGAAANSGKQVESDQDTQNGPEKPAVGSNAVQMGPSSLSPDKPQAKQHSAETSAGPKKAAGKIASSPFMKKSADSSSRNKSVPKGASKAAVSSKNSARKSAARTPESATSSDEAPNQKSIPGSGTSNRNATGAAVNTAATKETALDADIQPNKSSKKSSAPKPESVGEAVKVVNLTHKNSSPSAGLPNGPLQGGSTVPHVPDVPPAPKGKSKDTTASCRTSTSMGKATVPPSPKRKQQKPAAPLPEPSFASQQRAVQMVSPPSTSGALPAPAGLGVQAKQTGLTFIGSAEEPARMQHLAIQHLDEATEVLRSVEAAKQRVQTRIRAIARDRMAMAQSEAAHNSLALQEMLEAKATMQAALDRAEKARKAAEADSHRRRVELEAAAVAAQATHAEALALHDEENQRVLKEIVSKYRAAQLQLVEIEKAIEEQETAARSPADAIETRTALSASLPQSPPMYPQHRIVSPTTSSPLALSAAQDRAAPKLKSDEVARLALRITAIQEALDVLQHSADFEADSAVFLALRQELKTHREALKQMRTSQASEVVSREGIPTAPVKEPVDMGVSPPSSGTNHEKPLVAPIPVNHADELLQRLVAYEGQMKQQAAELESMRQEMRDSPLKDVVSSSRANGSPNSRLPQESAPRHMGISSSTGSTSSASTRSSSPYTRKRRGSMFNDPLGYYVPAVKGTCPRLAMDVKPSAVLTTLGIERKMSVRLSDKALRQLHTFVDDGAPKFNSPRENQELQKQTMQLSSTLSSQLSGGMRTGSPDRLMHSLMAAPAVQMSEMLAPKDCSSTIAMVLQGTVHRRVQILLQQIGRKITSTEQHVLKLLRQIAQHFTTAHRSKQVTRGTLAMAKELAESGQWEESQRLLHSIDLTQTGRKQPLRTIKDVKEAIDSHYVDMLQERSLAGDAALQAEAELHALLSAVAHAFFSQARREASRSANTPDSQCRIKGKVRAVAEQDPVFSSTLSGSKHAPGMGHENGTSAMHSAGVFDAKAQNASSPSPSAQVAHERDLLEAEILALTSSA